MILLILFISILILVWQSVNELNIKLLEYYQEHHETNGDDLYLSTNFSFNSLKNVE
jgi:hypothetical protein